jgi:hypothetical protein
VTSPGKKTGTVYVLVDPRDGCVRYVGATTKPLNVRLQGHKAQAAARVKAWIDELAAEGLTPRIEPIHEDVAELELRERERAEITRRVIVGEALLNESATAQGRRFVEQRQRDERIETERAAWEFAANQVRSVLGGPLAPGDVPPIPLMPFLVADYHSIQRAKEDVGRRRASGQAEWDVQAYRVEEMQAQAAEALWRVVRPIWGELRYLATQTNREYFDDVLAGRVGTVFKEPWADLEEAPRYLALLPWGMVAVSPWAALAERAGMDTAGSEFIDWVSDDPNVREALHVLLVRAGGRMGPLSALDNLDNLSRPSTGLVAMTAAHYPAFDLPTVLNREVMSFLKTALQDRQLTPAMADLVYRLDPRALDHLLGPNIAADADTRLGLPPGTSRDVLAFILEKVNPWRSEDFDKVISRADMAFPTVDVPDYKHFRGNTVPMFQTIAASLMASGVLPAQSSKTPADVVGEVRALWRGDLGRLEQVA